MPFRAPQKQQQFEIRGGITGYYNLAKLSQISFAQIITAKTRLNLLNYASHHKILATWHSWGCASGRSSWDPGRWARRWSTWWWSWRRSTWWSWRWWTRWRRANNRRPAWHTGQRSLGWSWGRSTTAVCGCRGTTWIRAIKQSLVEGCWR